MSPYKFFIYVVALLMLVVFIADTSSDVSAQVVLTIDADNVADIQPLASVAGRIQSARSTAFASDGQTVLVQFAPSILWDMQTFDSVTLPQGYASGMSPDGRYVVVSGTADGTQLWDSLTATGISLIPNGINALKFSPDGSTFFTHSSQPGLYQLWDTVTGAEIAVLNSQYTGYHVPEFSPDSQDIVLHGFDSTTVIWNIQTQEARLVLPIRSFGATFSSDGQTLITYESRSFQLWDTTTGRQLSGVEHGVVTNGVDGLFSPDNSTFLIWNTSPGYGNSNPRLWDISDPTQVELIAEIPALNTRGGFQFSPDSRWLGTYGARDDNTIRLFDTATGDLHTTLSAHTDTVSDFAFNTDGTLLFSASVDNTIKIWNWDGTEATELASLAGNNFRLSPDETTIVTIISNRVALIYGIPAQEFATQPIVIPARILPSSINVRPEPSYDAEPTGTAGGESVLVGGRNGDFLFLPEFDGWVLSDPTYIQLASDFPISFVPEIGVDMAIAQVPTATLPFPTWTPTATPYPTSTPGPLPPLSITNIPPAEIVEPPSGLVRMSSENLSEVQLLGVLPGSLSGQIYPRSSGTVSQDGAMVIMPASYSSMPTAWRLTDLSNLGGLDLEVRATAIVSAGSPSDDLIVFASTVSSNIIYFWDVTVGGIVGEITLPDSGLIQQLRFSPDGNSLISRGYRLNTIVWDTSTRTERFSIPAADILEFSPDSRVIVTVPRQGGILRAYDSMTGDELFQFNTGRQSIQRLFFNPAGTAVALFNNDSITVWSLIPESLGTQLVQLPGRFADVVISPDGQFLTTLATSNIAQIWSIEPFGLVSTFEADARSGLTYSPDGSFVVIGNPLQFVWLQTGEIITVDGNYAVANPTFSPDGASLLVDGRGSVMVFGIPTPMRTAWTPITGVVIPSAVNLRALPFVEDEVIGFASDEVVIGGRSFINNAVYLSELEGWIWSDNDYLDLGDYALSDLPLIYVETDQ